MKISSALLPKATVALTVVSLSLSGCASGNSTSADATKSGAGEVSSAPSSSVATLSASDVMFLQMMIPHHEQAIEMSKLVATNTSNSDVQDLAARIQATQQPEIDLMKKLLTDAGMSLTPDHMMGDDGMLSAEEIAELSNAQDNEFDVLYLSGMIGHHDGAIAMASEVSDSSNSDVRTLANNVITSQTAEIEKMTKLLAATS